MRNSLENLTIGSRRFLDMLWRNGPLSRAQIAGLTGFTRPAVTHMAEDLIGRGLLLEQPAQKGRRGQPARPLALRAEAGYAVGINFSTSYAEVGIVNFAGELVGQSAFPIPAPTPEAIGAHAAKEIGGLVARHGLVRSRQIGVGISIPADFDTSGVALPHRLFPDLAGPDLADRFAASLEMPALLENDGRASAIGERLLGIGAGYSSFMLVHLGHGVGGGLIIEGKPFRGALGNAGILGQYYPYGEQRPSGLDLLETLRAEGFAAPDFDWLGNAPEECRPIVDAWVKRAAGQLSGDLARISRFLAPDAVILAGRLPPAILDALAKAIDFAAVLRPMDDLPITPLRASMLGTAAGVIGAAAVPILNALHPDASANGRT